jgi:hypothetical protein
MGDDSNASIEFIQEEILWREEWRTLPSQSQNLTAAYRLGGGEESGGDVLTGWKSFSELMIARGS